MSLTIEIPDEDLPSFVLAQRLIAAEIGTQIPLEEIIRIHVAAASGSLLATEIVATVTNSTPDAVAQLKLDGFGEEPAITAKSA